MAEGNQAAHLTHRVNGYVLRMLMTQWEATRERNVTAHAYNDMFPVGTKRHDYCISRSGASYLMIMKIKSDTRQAGNFHLETTKHIG